VRQGPATTGKPAACSLARILLISYDLSARTIFFSHTKAANSTFSHGL